MRKSICICLAIILLQGCSAIINQIRVDNIKKKYSKLIVGTPRSEIIKTFGKPIEKEGDYIDYYTLCLPERSRAGDYIIADIQFPYLGVWEIFGTPYELYEAVRDCPYKQHIVLVYDKNEKLKQAFKIIYYLRLVSICKTLFAKVDECSANKDLSLIYFDYENGWFYIRKNEITCNCKGKFIKVYVTEIPSLKNKYEPPPLLKEVPETINKELIPFSINETIDIDYANDQFKISSIILYDENGRILNRLPDQDWAKIYPDSYIKMIADSMAYYCLNGNLKEYEQKEKPQILDLLLNL